MRNLNRMFLIVCAMLILNGVRSGAVFQDPEQARVAGLAGAAVTLVRNDYVSLKNPALIAVPGNMILVADSAILFRGLGGPSQLVPGWYNTSWSQCTVLGVYPLDIVTLGAGFSSFSASELYKENIGSLYLAGKLSGSFVGVRIKSLSQEYAPDEYLKGFCESYGKKSSKMTCDLGLYYPFTWGSLGICASNLVPVEVGVLGTQHLPLQLEAGVSYKRDWYRVIIDYSVRRSIIESDIAFGLEISPNKQPFTLRAGYDLRRFGCGATIRVSSISIDYALTATTGMLDNSLSHYLGITWSGVVPRR